MAAREFFRVATGLVDHFGWLDGVRLKVYLLILRETRWNPDGRWTGWTIEGIAFEARCSRRNAQRALKELAHKSPIPPHRKYIRYRIGRGSSPNWLEVLNPMSHRENGNESSPRPTRNTGTYADSPSAVVSNLSRRPSDVTGEGSFATERVSTLGSVSSRTEKQDPLAQRLAALLDSVDCSSTKRVGNTGTGQAPLDDDAGSLPRGPERREADPESEPEWGSDEFVLRHPAAQPAEPGRAPWEPRDDETADEVEHRDRDLDREQAKQAIAAIRDRCGFTGKDQASMERRGRQLSAAAAKRDKPKRRGGGLRKLGEASGGVVDFKRRQGGDRD